MRTKKFDKKLSLNKETVARLQDGEMKQVVGGSASYVDSKCCTFDCPASENFC